jgi:hypothetical protein
MPPIAQVLCEPTSLLRLILRQGLIVVTLVVGGVLAVSGQSRPERRLPIVC